MERLIRLLAVTLALALPASIGVASAETPCDEPPAAVTTTVTTTVPGRYRGKTAAHWAALVRDRSRQLASSQAMTHRLVVRKWQPTVMYALRLASAVSGVPIVQLAPVAHCESTYNPFARNGRYKGLFQLGWLPFGIFSPYDLVANALSAALTVKHDGSWRQWTCKP